MNDFLVVFVDIAPRPTRKDIFCPSFNNFAKRKYM